MIGSPRPVGLYKSRWIYSAPLKPSLLHIPYHNTTSALPRAMYGVMKNDSAALLSAYKSFSIQGLDGKWKPKWSHRRLAEQCIVGCVTFFSAGKWWARHRGWVSSSRSSLKWASMEISVTCLPTCGGFLVTSEVLAWHHSIVASTVFSLEPL